MGLDPRAPHYSPDGHWWWDGTAWRPVAPFPGRPAGGFTGGQIAALVSGAVIFVLITVAILGYVGYTRLDTSLRTSNITDSRAVQCDLLEHTQVHYHAALQILVGGSPISMPTNLGRTTGCYYWLHMHTGEPGIIHIESPNVRTFTLADFFQVWSMWSGQKELIDSQHVSTMTLSGSQKLVAYVDSGSGPQVFTGDPAAIVLQEREVITLEITPPAVSPPPPFNWNGF